MYKILVVFLLLNSSLCSQIVNSTAQSNCVPATFKLSKLNTQTVYSWDFGNGTTSNLPNPTVTYTTPGVYTIKEGNDTYSVTVFNKPTLKFDSLTPSHGCLPFTFTLKDISTYPPNIAPVLYSWTFGDGSTKNGNPLTHTITNYEYDVSVSMLVNTNNPSCDTSINIPGYIKTLKQPTAKISQDVYSACFAPATVKYTNNSTFSSFNQVSYEWYVNGTFVSSAKDLGSRVYNNEGTYTVILKVKNQFGCISEDTSVFVLEKPRLSLIVPDTICGNSPNTEYVVIDTFRPQDSFKFDFVAIASGQQKYMEVQSRIDDSLPFGLKNVKNDGYIRFSVTKIDKKDARCKTTVIDSIFLMYNYPDLTIDLDTSCSYPSYDTTIASNFKPYIDSLYISVSYRNKYNWFMKNNSLASTPKGDTFLPTYIDNYLDVDSFYRKSYYIFASATSKNIKYGCIFTTETFKENYFKFYNFIKTDKTKGCAPLEVQGEGLFSRNSLHDTITDIVDSVIWHWGDGTIEKNDTFRFLFNHTYNTSGVYKVFAVSYNQYGCIDTSNFIYIKVGEYFPPRFSISKDSICPYETIVFTDTSYNEYKNIFFRTDDYRSLDCGLGSSSARTSIHDGGWNYVYMYGEYEECEAVSKDSFFVKGPTFEIEYNRNCQTQDSVFFYLKRLRNHNNDSFIWTFGDGTSPVITTDTFTSHLFPISGDYSVEVSSYSSDPNYCIYKDSTLIKSRHVKAIFFDSLLCKSDQGYFPDSIFPYKLDPTHSLEADYLCSHTYTWLIEDLQGNKYPPITYIDKVDVAIPKDTVNLSLIARDENGCEDTFTRKLILADFKVDFSIDKYFMCGKEDTIIIKDLSYSPHKINSKKWSITKFTGNNTNLLTVNNVDTIKFGYTIPNVVYDSFLVTLSATDTLNCREKVVSKKVYFSNVKASIDGPRKICVSTNFTYRDTIDRGNNFTYNWYVDYADINQHGKSAIIKINSLGSHEIKVVKINLQTNCVSIDTFNVFVEPKPKIRIDNTFDTTLIKCFPNKTTIYAFDTLNIPFDASWSLNGNPFTVKDTSTFILDIGVNKILGVITTDYGCSDTFVNYDTVIKVNAIINTSRDKVCKGDTIRFFLTEKSDIDSVFWNLGNGSTNTDNKDDFYYVYNSANFQGDTVSVIAVLYGDNGQCAKGIEKKLIVKETISEFEINEGDTVICFQDIPIKNLSPKGDSFEWHIDYNYSSSENEIGTIKFPYPDTFSVQLFSYVKGIGCVDTSEHKVILLPSPKLTVLNDSVCAGDTTKIVFTDSLPNTKIYLNPNIENKNPYTSSPISLYLDSSTSFVIKSVSPYGCTDSVKADFLVWQSINLLTLDTIIEAGKPVIIPFQRDINWSYSWDPPLIEPSCNDCDYPEVRYYLAQKHILTAKNNYGCFDLTTSYFIDVYPNIVVEVPTAFTPNGDGNNDILYARGFGIKKLLSFKIYNRFGQLLFMTNNENEGWDGFYKGEMQNSEPYFYTYEAEAFIPGKIITGEGSFMLLR